MPSRSRRPRPVSACMFPLPMSATMSDTGSAIDLEAYRRGTSVYFPDLVIPMLPERLSNDLCSLVPDQDRPAFTAILEFNRKGKRTGQKFCKSMIRSRQRFTYTTVRQILYDRDPEARKTIRLPSADAGRGQRRWPTSCSSDRMDRGSIGFDIPEPEIRLEDDKVAIDQPGRTQPGPPADRGIHAGRQRGGGRDHGPEETGGYSTVSMNVPTQPRSNSSPRRPSSMGLAAAPFRACPLPGSPRS